jgi:hypothetical protein
MPLPSIVRAVAKAGSFAAERGRPLLRASKGANVFGPLPFFTIGAVDFDPLGAQKGRRGSGRNQYAVPIL